MIRRRKGFLGRRRWPRFDTTSPRGRRMRDTTAVCDTLCHGVSSGDGILYHPRTDESTHIPSTSTDSIPTPRQHDAAPTPHCMPRGDTEAWASCDAEELRGDFNHRDGSHNEREETAPHCVTSMCLSRLHPDRRAARREAVGEWARPGPHSVCRTPPPYALPPESPSCNLTRHAWEAIWTATASSVLPMRCTWRRCGRDRRLSRGRVESCGGSDTRGGHLNVCICV